MPQLDRVLQLLQAGTASQIILEADTPIHCVTAAGTKPVSQQMLSRQQVIALINEVAGFDDKPAVAAGSGIRFLYDWGGEQWLVAQDVTTDPEAKLKVVVRRWVDKAPAPGPDIEGLPPVIAAAAAAPAPDTAPAPARPAARVSDVEVASHHHRRRADNPLGPFASEHDGKAALEKLLLTQVERGAADLHLRVGEPPILRLGGDMKRIEGEPVLDDATLTAMMWSIMPEKNRGEFDDHWDTDFAHEIADVSRFRVNVLRDRKGTAAVIRTIANGTVTVEQMGISPEVQQLCSLTKGLVLVTGPTGSGKSTTLCALVDLINRTRSDHIITIEDPIEFVHESKKCLITQRQVGVHTQSFKSALRAALREDPDIILVGELRDLETIAIAMETAETGHLVFGTLHTSTAASTINRIVDQFPADRQEQIRVMLAESLRGVVSQTLCKKKGGGRVAAREILLVNKAVSALIREGKTVQINNVIQTQRKMGMETLNDALLTLVKNGSVEAEEAFNKSAEKKDMAAKLRAIGIDTSGMSSEE